MTTTGVSSIKPIKIASFHDVHLGHHKTFIDAIVKGFDPIFKNEAEISSWDMIVYPGDLFDRLLFLTNDYLYHIVQYFCRVLKLCKKHDIVIRILEGTPGHDHKQSHLMPILNMAFEMGVDLKHVTELSIEYIERFDLHFLYVPDEWNTDVYETYEEARMLIQRKGLQKVDYCLLHGAFNYQIDASLNPKAHNEELWCNLVNYYIFAGHVHYKSQYKNILVAGSFDRLAHGEEEPKGWLTCEVKENGEHEIIFHENKNATLYVTLDVRKKTIEEVIQFIQLKSEHFPKYSHIRLYVDEEDDVKQGLNAVKQRFSYFFFTLKVDKREKERRQKTLKMVTEKYQAIALDKDNINRLIEDRLRSLPDTDVNAVMALFNKHV